MDFSRQQPHLCQCSQIRQCSRPVGSHTATVDRTRDRWLQNIVKSMLPSLQSMVSWKPILITQNEDENCIPRFALNHQRYTPLCHCLQPSAATTPLENSWQRPWTEECSGSAGAVIGMGKRFQEEIILHVFEPKVAEVLREANVLHWIHIAYATLLLLH